MASLPGDCFELRHIYTWQGKEMQNVYFYKYALLIDPLGTTISQVLAERWVELIQPVIMITQMANLVTTQVSVRNLMDPWDKYDLFQNVAGGQGVGDGLPAHDTVSFSLQGENGSTRQGRKAIGVVAEGTNTNGILTHAVLVTLYTALRVALAAPVTTFFIFTQNTFTPVIVKRVKEIIDGNPEYRLPLTREEQILNTIVSVGLSLVVGTQDTRKR